MTSTNYIDVYNLKPGNEYKFRVTARNRYGWGRPVATADYVVVSEPEYLPEFCQPLPGETKVLSRHSAILQCHVSTDVPIRKFFFIRRFYGSEKIFDLLTHNVGRHVVYINIMLRFGVYPK